MAIPAEALGVSVGVLVYSILCLLLSTLLVCLLVSFNETWSCEYNYVFFTTTC